MSKNIRFVGAIVVISALSLVPTSGAAAAQGRGRGQAKKVEKAEKKHEKAEKKDEKKDEKRDRRDDQREIAVDRDAHVRVIHDYARGGSLPPGLAKRRALPPGLRAQLHERGELPPGLQKRLVAVPRPLITRLPPVPPYYHRYFAGDDFLVVDSRTNRIVAIISDVWR